MEKELSFSNIIAISDDLNSNHVFGDVVVEKVHDSKKSGSMQPSKSINTLFGKLACNNSFINLPGSNENVKFLHCSKSFEDLNKSRVKKQFVPKYKQLPRHLQIIPPPMKYRKDAIIKSKIARTIQMSPRETIDKVLEASIFDVTLDSSTSREIETTNERGRGDPKPDDDSKREPKHGLKRKDSCLIEFGRNKISKSTNSSRNLENRGDVAPKFPSRCESPNRDRSLPSPYHFKRISPRPQNAFEDFAQGQTNAIKRNELN